MAPIGRYSFFGFPPQEIQLILLILCGVALIAIIIELLNFSIKNVKSECVKSSMQPSLKVTKKSIVVRVNQALVPAYTGYHLLQLTIGGFKHYHVGIYSFNSDTRQQ